VTIIRSFFCGLARQSIGRYLSVDMSISVSIVPVNMFCIVVSIWPTPQVSFVR